MTERIFLGLSDVGSLGHELHLHAFGAGWIAPVGSDIDAFEFEFASLSARLSALAESSGGAVLVPASPEHGVEEDDDFNDATAWKDVIIHRLIEYEPCLLSSTFPSTTEISRLIELIVEQSRSAVR